MIRVGINGFGRIGRCALKLINNMNNVEVVLINNLTGVEQLAYLYKYDTL
jgi:glyceraldehyde 3-phosphate dehydrogenase